MVLLALKEQKWYAEGCSDPLRKLFDGVPNLHPCTSRERKSPEVKGTVLREGGESVPWVFFESVGWMFVVADTQKLPNQMLLN